MSLPRILTVLALAATLAACDAVAPASSPAESARLGIDGRASARAEKVAVCHVDDTGGYMLKEISGNALGAHMNHGDGIPGGEAPGGGVFNEACEVVEEEPAFACAIETSTDPEHGPITTLTLTINDTDTIRSTNLGVSTLSGSPSVVVSVEAEYTPEGDGVVSATAVLAENPAGPYEAQLDLLSPFDAEDEVLLAVCGPVTVG